MHVLGIHRDPVAAKVRIAKATREGVRLGADAYGYPRAVTYVPSAEERDWLRYEAARVGEKPPKNIGPDVAIAIANDLKPVAALILKASVGNGEWALTSRQG